MRSQDSLWGIYRVWLRYFDVFTKSFFYYFITTFTEPLLYLLSFGYGVGSMVGQISLNGVELSYRKFIFSGIVGQTLLFQGFFEASYGGFIRMYYQKIFHAMSVTPITLSEVLWGEILWDATKATVAAEVVILIGVLTGDFAPLCLLTALPVCFLSAVLFSALGLAVAAFSKSIDQISYPQYLLIFPMFLFCGVFYPTQALPPPFNWIAWALPLTSVNSIIRTLTLDLQMNWFSLPILGVWLIGAVVISRRSMFRRLIK